MRLSPAGNKAGIRRAAVAAGLENFQLFLVEHPLVAITRRLIWGVYSAENQYGAFA